MSYNFASYGKDPNYHSNNHGTRGNFCSNFNNSNYGRDRNNSGIQCFNCHRFGHKQKNCKLPKRKVESSNFVEWNCATKVEETHHTTAKTA